MISSSAATSRGAAMLLASGMKISAEPKPENPRAVPDRNAMAQIASATLALRSAGTSPNALVVMAGHLAHETDLFRHGRACPGHPRLSKLIAAKTWMPGTSPGMTIFAASPRFYG